MNEKMYVVSSYDRNLIGVFSTSEKAQEAIKQEWQSQDDGDNDEYIDWVNRTITIEVCLLDVYDTAQIIGNILPKTYAVRDGEVGRIK